MDAYIFWHYIIHDVGGSGTTRVARSWYRGRECYLFWLRSKSLFRPETSKIVCAPIARLYSFASKPTSPYFIIPSLPSSTKPSPSSPNSLFTKWQASPPLHPPLPLHQIHLWMEFSKHRIRQVCLLRTKCISHNKFNRTTPYNRSQPRTIFILSLRHNLRRIRNSLNISRRRHLNMCPTKLHNRHQRLPLPMRLQPRHKRLNKCHHQAFQSLHKKPSTWQMHRKGRHIPCPCTHLTRLLRRLATLSLSTPAVINHKGWLLLNLQEETGLLSG